MPAGASRRPSTARSSTSRRSASRRSRISWSCSGKAPSCSRTPTTYWPCCGPGRTATSATTSSTRARRRRPRGGRVRRRRARRLPRAEGAPGARARPARLREARPATAEADLGEWDELVERLGRRDETVEIALVGKYVKLHDAYLSVHEALKHAGIANGCHVQRALGRRRAHDPRRGRAPSSPASTGCSFRAASARAAGRGRSSPAASRARTRSRTSASASGCTSPSPSSRATCAGSRARTRPRWIPETPHPVIDLLPEQKEVEDLGGTMRLGAQAVELAEGTRAREIVRRRAVIAERHRHRYEVNNAYRQSARRRRARRERHVPGGPPRRDRRAARPPVVRRVAVPPRVQVAADAAGAALPRVRRGRARSRARASDRACATRAADPLEPYGTSPPASA